MVKTKFWVSFLSACQLMTAPALAQNSSVASSEWGKAGPPPRFARPLPPDPASKSSIELKQTLDIPPAPAPGDTDVNLAPLPLDKMPQLVGANGVLPPVRLEASFNEPIDLAEVLSAGLEKNLAIRISQTDVRSKRYNVLGSVGRMLPNMAMGYTTPRTWFDGGQSDSPSFYNVLYIPVFNGGEDVFRLLRTSHEAKAARFASSTTTNDTLLDIYNKYQDLLLQYALLQVRIKAVEVSQTQLRENQDRKAAGEGTVFEVLQSETRLAQDQQFLIRQGVAFRKAALHLAVAINVSPAINLLPRERILSETLLVDSKLTIGDLLTNAIDHRPELKEHEQLRLAARRHVQEAMGSLLPNSKFFLATNAQPKANSSSGIVIPAGDSPFGGLITTGGGGGGNSFTAGFIINWFLPGMGLIDVAESLSLREQARKATLKANDVLLHVVEEVRASYLDVLASKQEIAVTCSGVNSAREELRVADQRVRYGVGTNLELLSAQRDYIEALARQAEAIVSYRKSQARLLRDTGTISIAALTTDKRPFRIKAPNAN